MVVKSQRKLYVVYFDSKTCEETSEQSPTIHSMSHHSFVRILTLEGYISEPSNGATPKLSTRSVRVCSIDRRPYPLPVIYVFGANTSEYTWCPIISYLLYQFNCTFVFLLMYLPVYSGRFQKTFIGPTYNLDSSVCFKGSWYYTVHMLMLYLF